MVLLSALIAVASLSGIALAQEDPDCYPIPAGGCETTPEQDEEQEETAPEEAPTCQEILDGIADGTIDPADLPEGALAECGCPELQELVDAGTLDTADLPDGCEEQEQVLAEDDTEETPEDPEDGPEEAVLASTGIDGGMMALLAIAGLMGGLSMVVMARTRA
jgi:hypothetical protein